MSGVQVGPLSTGTTGPVTVLNVIEVGGEPKYVDWISTVGIDFVYVKSSTTYLTYTYNPETFHGEGLSGPPGADGPSGISPRSSATPMRGYARAADHHAADADAGQHVRTADADADEDADEDADQHARAVEHADEDADQHAGAASITPTATPTRTGTPAACEPALIPRPLATGLSRASIIAPGRRHDAREPVVVCRSATDHRTTTATRPSTTSRPPARATAKARSTSMSASTPLPDCGHAQRRRRRRWQTGFKRPPPRRATGRSAPAPTGQDYVQDLVDKDGGEPRKDLGAFEFQIKFDHKIFDITAIGDTEWANGRSINCSRPSSRRTTSASAASARGRSSVCLALGEIGARL